MYILVIPLSNNNNNNNNNIHNHNHNLLISNTDALFNINIIKSA